MERMLPVKDKKLVLKEKASEGMLHLGLPVEDHVVYVADVIVEILLSCSRLMAISAHV